MQPREVRHLVVGELAEIRRVSQARERIAAAAALLIVAVRVDERDALAQEVIGVLQLAMIRVAIVVARRVHDPVGCAESARVPLLVARQRRAGIAENVVQVVAQRIVQQPHSAPEIIIVARRLPEMFAEDERVVARRFRIVVAVAIVVALHVAVAQHVVPIAVDVIEHRLDCAAVAVPRGASVVAEEVAGHMLHRIQSEPVALRLAQQPRHRAHQIRPRVLRHGITVRAVEAMQSSRQRRQGRVHVVIAVVRMPDEERAARRAAVARAEVDVRIFLRDVHQTGERIVLHLVGVVEVSDVVPAPVKRPGHDPQMKIPRHHARIVIRRRVPVVARHGEAAMVHDVVEVHAQPEAMGQFHGAQQLRLRAVARAHRALLILVPQIEWVKQVVADGEDAPTLGRRRQPERGVTGLRDLRHLHHQLVVIHVEELEHGIRAQAWRGRE